MLIGNEGVSSTNFSRVTKAYSKNAGVGSSRPAGNDSVEVSSSASLFNRALEVARDTPDIRADRVDQLRQEISEGRYFRDPAAVADKLVGDHT